MPKVDQPDRPKALRPFISLGIDIEYDVPGEEARGKCPFCERERRFYVNKSTGVWDCKVCGLSGNTITFLRLLMEWGSKSPKIGPYRDLAADRCYFSPTSLLRWGIVQSHITGEWLVPGYGSGGKIDQVYRYVKDFYTGKYKVIPLPSHTDEHGTEIGHGLHGVNLYNPKAQKIYLAEGIWDGIAIWEMLCATATIGERWILAGVDKPSANSLIHNACVLAVPSVNVFYESWLRLFAGKDVYLLYDNQHPRKHPTTGTEIGLIGYRASRKVGQLLSASEEPPASVHYLEWGTYDSFSSDPDTNGVATRIFTGYTPTLKDGYDVRDLLTTGSPVDRVDNLRKLFKMLRPMEGNWRPSSTGTAPSTSVQPKPCSSWQTLITAWRKALRWTEGLDRALSVMLACISSTKALGDQLWVKIIGPPSCGKSTLCEALSVNRKYVFPKSSITGFHSGYKSDKEGTEDFGLVGKLRDKTLVTKDGDTLLQAPNLGKILSEARDLYDRTARIQYLHGVSRDHEGCNITWILCGTSSLKAIDQSELGERFLDCVVMHSIDEELEDEILRRVAERAERNLSIESNGDASAIYDPELLEAMQLTGGYIDYIRTDTAKKLSTITIPPWALNQCIHLGKFVAYMRARPSKKQDETAEREFGARLVGQMVRLTKCLALVLNRQTVDGEVMRRVRRTALDTARGTAIDIVHHLYKEGDKGLSAKSVALLTHQTEDRARQLLRFLGRIGATQVFDRERVRGMKPNMGWRLTPKVRELYESVVLKKSQPREDEDFAPVSSGPGTSTDTASP